MLSPLIILSPSILITDLPPITYLSLTWLHPHEFFSTTSSPSTAAVNDTDSRFEPQSSVCFPSPFCRVCSPPLLVKLPLSIPKLHSRSYLSLKLPRASLPKESIQPLKTGAATIPLPVYNVIHIAEEKLIGIAQWVF
ncbi:uncharacterized protein LOC130749148 [Lotus japonicus]|uniref:uncharacterized protein LOC130749148 n=1 Tax=Lotus japonicus TaxID=34305 RepID=UPI00258E5A47|nr:uncharacterized protein LOC130749148 [Lotus japonicus]